jgi:hypothetical protein
VLLLGLCAFLALVCFLPGYALARRWHLSDAETFAVAPALSIALVSLGTFVIYAASWPAWTYTALTVVVLVPSVPAAPGLWRLLRSPTVRPLAVALGLMALWLLGWQLLPRAYSGGQLFHDWIEHYFRSRLFADQWDRFSMWGPYHLPARPPLVNLACGYVMAVFNHHMPVYQAVYALLSALAVLPAALLAQRWCSGATAAVAAVTLLLALNPMWVQNATYSWSRGPTTYFILLTVALYVRTLGDRPQTKDMVLIFGIGGLALLAHYSAGPYVVFLAGHLIWRVVRGRLAGWPSVLAAGVAGAVVLAPWFIWCWIVFGGETTVGNNSSVATIAPLSTSEYLQTAWVNLRDSLVAPMWDPHRIGMFHQSNALGYLRDRIFIVYQTNLWFGLTVTHLVALAAVLYLGLRRRWLFGSTAAGFWWGFVPVVAVLGILVHGPKDHPLGLAHICLQPLIFLGVIWVAAWFVRASRTVQFVWLGGLLVEAMGTIVLQFYIQSIAVDEVGRPEPGRVVFDQSDGLSHHTYANFQQKALHHLTFLGDVVAPVVGLVWVGLAVVVALMIGWAFRQTAVISPSGR